MKKPIPQAEPPGTTTPPVVMLRLPQVMRITGLCRTMVYELEAAGRFPRRVKIGERAVAWVQAEVDAWNVERVAQSRGGTSPTDAGASARCARSPTRAAV